jgi:hypothetical protein
MNLVCVETRDDDAQAQPQFTKIEPSEIHFFAAVKKSFMQGHFPSMSFS